MEEPLLDIENVCNSLNDDISKLITTHLSPLINDMKLASTSLNAIKNILYSLPEYKELEKELSELKVEHESLKKHLNNKGISMEITEKYANDYNNKNNIDFNISTANKVINLTSNTSLSEEINILSNTSDDDDDDDDIETENDNNITKIPINLNETTKTVTIDIAKNSNENNITLSNKEEIQKENIDFEEESVGKRSEKESELEDSEEDEQDEQDGKMGKMNQNLKKKVLINF
jgi:hypothetical protein